MHRNVINASTLKAVGGGDTAWELPVNGDVCLFFVIKSPDDKVNFFFPVNPYQGYVKIRSDGRLNSCSRAAFINESAATCISLCANTGCLTLVFL